MLVIELRNDSDHAIFVSYVPPTEGTTTKFLSYGLQRRTAPSNDFAMYGEGFHFVPKLNPINPRTVVTFRLIHYPSEKGEYRLGIAFYEDEDVYRMINERLTDLSETELKGADKARKYVFSESFFVSPRFRKK